MTGYNVMLYHSLESAPGDSGAAAFAIGAAARIGAHLNVLAPHVDVLATGHWKSRSSAEVEHDANERRAALDDAVHSIVARAHAAGVSASASTDWAHPFGPIAYIADQARLHDLVVMGTDQSVFLSERKFAEHVLFESGRPVVVVPRNHVTPISCRRVMVAWDHTRSAARALHDALPFLRLADEVLLMAIGGEKRFQIDLDGRTIQSAMSQKGLNARFGQTELGTRSIGQALQQEALSCGADLLVMGGFGHSRLREFILGGATREVLDKPDLPVLMSH